VCTHDSSVLSSFRRRFYFRCYLTLSQQATHIQLFFTSLIYVLRLHAENKNLNTCCLCAYLHTYCVFIVNNIVNTDITSANLSTNLFMSGRLYFVICICTLLKCMLIFVHLFVQYTIYFHLLPDCMMMTLTDLAILHIWM